MDDAIHWKLGDVLKLKTLNVAFGIPTGLGLDLSWIKHIRHWIKDGSWKFIYLLQGNQVIILEAIWLGRGELKTIV